MNEINEINKQAENSVVVSKGQKIKDSERKKAIITKATEKAIDKSNFDFSLIAKKSGKNTNYNYQKIASKLGEKNYALFFIQAGILSEAQIKNITSHKSTFADSKTKFGEFKTEKKAIRNFKQAIEAQIENCKDKSLLPKLSANLKFYLNMVE